MSSVFTATRSPNNAPSVCERRDPIVFVNDDGTESSASGTVERAYLGVAVSVTENTSIRRRVSCDALTWNRPRARMQLWANECESHRSVMHRR